MSATIERAIEPCLNCGSPLQTDQEWCLECGTARTLIRRPPDWRIPVAIVGAVIGLALLAFLIALVNLSGKANQIAAPAATTTRAPQTTSTAAKPQISSWPVGLPGWTVRIAGYNNQPAAQAKATEVLAMGIPVGVLSTSQHPALPPGHWMVFSGRYPTEAAATAELSVLKAKGLTGLRTRLVGRAGQ